MQLSKLTMSNFDTLATCQMTMFIIPDPEMISAPGI